MGKNDISDRDIITILVRVKEQNEDQQGFSLKPSSPASESGTPIRHILVAKNADDVKRFEETEDCFILDFDPFQPLDLSDLLTSAAHNYDKDAPDVYVVAETGKVACRDYPHPRHLCAKFPFETTSNESHCDMCHCYVCDTPAPCLSWTEPKPAHCHASKGDRKYQQYLIDR